MTPSTLFFVLLIVTVSYKHVQCIAVFKTSEDLPNFLASGSAITLRNSPNISLRESTTCLRFLNYFIVKDQMLLSFPAGSLAIGTSWSKHNSLNLYDIPRYENLDVVTGVFWRVRDPEHGVKTLHFEFPEWPLKIWNSFCFTMSFVGKEIIIHLNGILVLSRHINVENSLNKDLLMNDLTFMGAEIGSTSSFSLGKIGWSMPGKMADINVWSNVLTSNQIKQWSGCSDGIKGDLINGDHNQLLSHGLSMAIEDKSKMCWNSFPPKYLLTALQDKTFDFFQTIEFCHYLGGQVAAATTEEKAEKMIELLVIEEENCGSEIFTGFINSDENPTFWNVIDKQPMAWEKWLSNEPNNFGGKEHCVTMKLLPYSLQENKNWGLNDISCKDKFCPICELQEFQQFHMRGACPEQDIETVFYIEVNQNQMNKNSFLGYKGTNITWDPANNFWKIQRQSNVIATTNDTYEYPIGTHLWYFTDGKCFDPDAPGRRMNLHRKPYNDEFCCLNGLCINSSLRCDLLQHCRDGSDEFNCSVLIIPTQNYDKAKPPSTDKTLPISPQQSNIDLKTNISVTITILNINDIDDDEYTITLRFNMETEWRDPRLKFRDLKTNENLNTVNVEDIWYPHWEIPSNLKNSITSETYDTVVRKEGNFSKFNEKDDIIRVHIYDGSKNSIVMSKRDQMELFCNFDYLYYYPFDEEVCSLDMTLKGTDNTFASLDLFLVDNGPSFVSHCSIKKWKIEKINSGNSLKFQAKVFLNRKTSMIIIAIYLPTLLLSAISQATNYMDSEEKDYFGLVLKVNLTAMVALAIIYRSVSTSLPNTTTIKMIEIWLLSSLIYPFFVILINVLIHKTVSRKSKVDNYMGSMKAIKTDSKTTINVGQPDDNCHNTESNPPPDDRTSYCMEAYVKADSKFYYLKTFSHYIMPFIYICFTVTYFVCLNSIPKIKK